MNELKGMREEVVRIAIAAGKRILEIYEQDFAVYEKDDRSPLTEADTASHTIIKNGLSALTVGGKPLPLLSEEGGNVSFDERKSWQAYWLVDPLDGTKEFIKRNGEFTVNIALIQNAVPVFGVVYVPVSDTLYWGTILDQAQAVKISGASSPDQKAISLPIKRTDTTIRIVASRSHMTPETEHFIKQLDSGHDRIELVSSGSSIKLCLVAEGAADIYPRFAPTMEWDTAAGDAVCRGARCSVTQKDGINPLLYNKEDLLNPWFLVFDNRMKSKILKG